MGNIISGKDAKDVNPKDLKRPGQTGLSEGDCSHVFKLFAYINFFFKVKIVQQSKQVYLMLEFSLVIIADIIQ